MSLIEQAARRLEELRRSGAVTGTEATPAREVPVPERVADTAHARPDTAHARPDTAHARPDTAHARPAPPPARPAGGDGVRAEARRPGKRIDLDLKRLSEMGFLTPESPRTQTADEFRVVKRPIIRNALGKEGVRVKNGNLVMVTSALPGEGKTFTSINLALSVALEFDNTVLLVDGDVAHPSFPSLIGSPPSPGLLDLLTRDDLDVGDALVKTNVEKLSLLPAGGRHHRSTELLASEQMASLLRELGTRYSDRIIIFDSPPLLATTQARVLASLMGQIVMVVAADSTSHHAVSQALATIENCEIVLMVLNKATRSEVGTYYAYYGDDGNP
jgi:exopolysaccharide/PEP-CTERM locus tyrosine autokinase